MHPLISEDAGFLGKGVRQLELGFEYAVAHTGQDVFSNALAAELSYGLNDKTDLLFSVPREGWNSAGISASGFGDVALEAKLGIGEKAGWTFAVKPGLSLPTGDYKKGLGAGKTGFWTYAIAGHTAGPWQFFLNTGFVLNRNSSGKEVNIVKGSAAVALEVAPKVLACADLTTETAADPGSAKHPITGILGLGWSPTGNLDLDAGVKLGLTSPAQDSGLLFGTTFRF